MIDLIPPEDYDAIITNAGGCGSHLRHYGHLLDDDPQYRGRRAAWDAKLRDVHEWLVEIGCRAPIAAPFDRAIFGDVSRFVSPRARSEGVGAAARAAPSAARRDRSSNSRNRPGAAAAPASTR